MAVAQKTRYRWLDVLRGAAVVNMVAFHFCYDWFEVFARQPGWYFLWPSRLWQQAICCTFILTAGFSAHLGRRALRRLQQESSMARQGADQVVAFSGRGGRGGHRRPLCWPSA